MIDGMRNISAVCFDAFGTLISYQGRRTSPYRHLLQMEQSAEFDKLPFLTRNVSVDTLAQERGVSHMLPKIQAELNEELQGLALFSEVELILSELKHAGKRIAVCSNLAAAYGPAVYKLLPTMDAYILSFEVGVAKPDPTIYKLVCTAIECPPDSVLFIGDSKRCDLYGPQAYGLQSQWLDRRSGMTLLDAISGTVTAS